MQLMGFPGVAALIIERQQFLDTMESLTREQFTSGTTLCSEWAPRDILAHLVGTQELKRYIRGGLRLNAVNARQVADARLCSRTELLERGRKWASSPSRPDRGAAGFLIGDVAVHHQDVRRGLGLPLKLSDSAAGAVFREGVFLSTGTKRNLLRYRVVPTTTGGHSLGRGTVVRGSSDAIGLWLAGRKGLEPELEFVS